MKRSLLLVIFVIFIVPSLFSQADFQRGYIVMNNGDTLTGFVNYQKKSANYYTCNFKSLEIAKPMEYSPENIKAYGIFEGRKYYSAKIDNKAVFLEYLVNGNLSLLLFEMVTERFFILDQQGRILELKQSTTIEPWSNQFYNSYKELLIAKMKPFDMYQTIRNTRLEENSLITLFKQYYEVSNSIFEIVARTKSKSFLKDYSILGTNRIKFGIVVGASFVYYKVTSNDGSHKYIGEAKFNTIKTPIFGIYAEGSLIRLVPQITFKSELLFQQVSLYGFSNYNDNDYYYNSTKYYNDLYIDYTNIKLRENFKYNFNISKFRFAPYFGFSYNYKVKTSFYRFSEELKTSINLVKSSEYTNLKLIKSNISSIGGISIGYKISNARIININIDYELGIHTLEKIEGSSNGNVGLSDSGSNINITFGLSI